MSQSLRIAINGFGRIGRHVLRAFFERGGVPGVSVVAINDLGDPETLAHLLRYDTTHGRFDHAVVLSDNNLAIGDASVAVLSEPSPEKLPWRSLGIDIVLECTGRFRSRADASRHLTAGAGRVIIGAAPFDEVDAMVVYGVNHHAVRAEHRVLSSVSCTTHALLPLIKILDEAFGLESGLVTEIHAMTSDQVPLDHVHRDLRRARAGAHNIIPTTSSALGALWRILPDMQGRVDGYSVRVPTLNVACIDLSFVARRALSVDEINQLFYAHSQGAYAGILGWCDEPLVSSDFVHEPWSLIFDSLETRVVGRQAKVLVWYDNEWGYANRLLDLCGALVHDQVLS